MYLDKENMFSEGQAVTATALSTNIVELGGGDAGSSEEISLFVNAGAAYTGTGTIAVSILTAAALNPAGDALDSPVTLATYPVGNEALTSGGKLLAARLPHGCKRYLRLNYAVTGTLSGGNILAGLAADIQSN